MGREFYTTKSACSVFDPNCNIKNEVKKYKYVLLIKNDAVEFKRADDEISFDNLVELRAFDENKELHIIMSDGTPLGRIREDGVGEEIECIDEKQKIWGRAASRENGYTLFHSDRGIDIKVPVSAENGDTAYLILRGYLAPDRFEFVDFRICGVATGKGEIQ
ncbi:MAG: hypothetical protein K5647_05175 [Clostridiales bacterium]|nr:hypothetical protein [Clostridiales bacterium]